MAEQWWTEEEVERLVCTTTVDLATARAALAAFSKAAERIRREAKAEALRHEAALSWCPSRHGLVDDCGACVTAAYLEARADRIDADDA